MVSCLDAIEPSPCLNVRFTQQREHNLTEFCVQLAKAKEDHLSLDRIASNPFITTTDSLKEVHYLVGRSVLLVLILDPNFAIVGIANITKKERKTLCTASAELSLELLQQQRNLFWIFSSQILTRSIDDRSTFSWRHLNHSTIDLNRPFDVRVIWIIFHVFSDP